MFTTILQGLRLLLPLKTWGSETSGRQCNHPKINHLVMVKQDLNVSLGLFHSTFLSLQLNPKDFCSQTGAEAPLKGCSQCSGSVAKGRELPLICIWLDICVFINSEIR